MSPRAGLDGCGKSDPHTGIRSPDRPVRSELIYWRSYFGPFLEGIGKELLVGLGGRTALGTCIE